jgi:hypothetical protein
LQNILTKALGKRELIFKRRAGGQSNMTTLLYKPGQSHMTISIPRQYPASTPNHNRAKVVPSKYSEPAPLSIFPKNTFVKPKLDTG